MFDSDRPLRIGTRGSALALAQARLVVDRFHTLVPARRAELRVIRTEGDIDRMSPLTEIGGRGVFTNAIEAAMLDGDVDAAVHSAKDLPSALHPLATIVAFPERDDPRDVLVSRHGTTLERLPVNPIIGTSSRRREVQIRRLRPDAVMRSIRGNVDTRLRNAEGPEFDAIVLAAAGIRRMGWEDRISEVLPVEVMVPAPGQGALAVQAKTGSEAAALLRAIDDSAVSLPVEIERAFLAATGAGCDYPVGAYVARERSGYRLHAMLADPAGSRFAFADEALTRGDERRHAVDVATRLAIDVGQLRGPRMWNGANADQSGLMGVRVVVTRPRHQADSLIDALKARGATALMLPTIRIELAADTSALDVALDEVKQGRFDWIVFTSANAVAVTAERMATLGIRSAQKVSVQVATVGPATAAAAREAGFDVGVIAETATAEGLIAALGDQISSGQRVLYPRSSIGRKPLPDELRRAGAEVIAIDAYRTVPVPDADPVVRQQIERGAFDAVVFASPSAVRGFVDLFHENRAALAAVPVFCAGPITAEEAVRAGLRVAAISENPEAAAIVETIVSHWQGLNDGKNSQYHTVSNVVVGRSAE